MLDNWHLKRFKKLFCFIGVKVPKIGFSVRPNVRFNQFPSFLGNVYPLGDAASFLEKQNKQKIFKTDLFKDEFSLRVLYLSEMIHSSPVECSRRNAVF